MTTHDRRTNTAARLLAAGLVVFALVAVPVVAAAGSPAPLIAPAPSAALASAPVPATAGPGLRDVTVTLSNTSGGGITRFTFNAVAAVEVSDLRLEFPEGVDLSKVTIDVVTIDTVTLTRVPVATKPVVAGTAIDFKLDPAVRAGSTLRVQIHDAYLPNKGGTFGLRVRYTSGGTRGSIPPVRFAFDTVTPAEALSRWLEEQPWVKSWNTVDFLSMFVQPQRIVLAVPLLFFGWLTSIALVGIAFPFAVAGGLALAFMKMSKIPPLRWLAAIYINVIRGTPLFLQIYIAFVGLPIAGLRAPLFVTGVVVLALNSSAYLAEIFRAGIQSIHRGQFEAASSLGMTYAQAMLHVIIPQTVKRVLPTMTSEFILLFKDTALLSAVGIFELMLYSNSMATRSGNLTPFVVAAVYYLIVTIPLINWVGSLERRLAISEHGHTPDAPKRRGGLFWRPASAGEVEELAASVAEHESR